MKTDDDERLEFHWLFLGPFAVRGHGQYFRRIFFVSCDATSQPLRGGVLNDVSQGSVLQNLCRRVANVQKHLVQGPVLDIVLDQVAQLLGVAKGRQGPVNQADDLGKVDF